MTKIKSILELITEVETAGQKLDRLADDPLTNGTMVHRIADDTYSGLKASFYDKVRKHFIGIME